MGSFERRARITYAGHRWQDKAIASGKAMDNALKLKYTKGGTTNCRFLAEQYIKFFDYEILVREKVDKREALCNYPDYMHESIINDKNSWFNR